MGTRLHLLVAGCAALASLALALNALAATPQLFVSGPPGTAMSGEAVVELREDKSDAAPSKITVYVPSGYLLNVSHAAGSRIGDLTASLQALEQSPDTVVDVRDGSVVVADRSSADLAAGATRCTGSATHDAIWMLHAVVNARTLDIPVYVDATTGIEAAFGSAKVVLCLGNPYAQAGPARAPLGAKLLNLRLTLAAGTVTNPPARGAFVWRAAVTPWTRDGTTPNEAGTTEAQSPVILARSVSLKERVSATRKRRGNRIVVRSFVTLSGRVLANGTGVARAKVTISGGGKSAGTVRTAADGTFTKRLALSAKTSFRVRVLVAARNASCANPLPAVLTASGCAGASAAAYRLTSGAVVARPRTR
jgi:hypothetical protein